MRFLRFYSKFSFNTLKNDTADISKHISKSIHPTSPAITRFAPSPTGYLHLGSLRTALYNYLLAKNTGGKFILRLEDTDQTRLVEGAEKNIYETLAWCDIHIDEGPVQGGKHAPYRQSERREIYKRYADELVKNGFAYKCYCSKERLNNLRETAMKLKPPTTVTYDRKCLHQEGEGDHPIIRFKSPETYDKITDLLFGTIDLQPQYNPHDRRYDDFVIMKSDGLPTYHFANVVDDHLMKITHVIRGEEWLSSTPKHVALYNAFGWTPPKFIHIPLLTTLKDKKLSKRNGLRGILDMKREILPEALVNFVALFGWSPPRLIPGKPVSEVMSMDELIQKFSLDNLTKGNAKVSDSKLLYFNKHHLIKLVDDEERLLNISKQFRDLTDDEDYLLNVLRKLLPNVNSMSDIYLHDYLFQDVKYDVEKASPIYKEILLKFQQLNYDLTAITKESYKKKDIFQAIRFALSNGTPGLSIPELIDLLTIKVVKKRVDNCIEILK